MKNDSIAITLNSITIIDRSTSIFDSKAIILNSKAINENSTILFDSKAIKRNSNAISVNSFTQKGNSKAIINDSNTIMPKNDRNPKYDLNGISLDGATLDASNGSYVGTYYICR